MSPQLAHESPIFYEPPVDPSALTQPRETQCEQYARHCFDEAHAAQLG